MVDALEYVLHLRARLQISVGGQFKGPWIRNRSSVGNYRPSWHKLYAKKIKEIPSWAKVSILWIFWRVLVSMKILNALEVQKSYVMKQEYSARRIPRRRFASISILIALFLNVKHKELNQMEWCVKERGKWYFLKACFVEVLFFSYNFLHLLFIFTIINIFFAPTSLWVTCQTIPNARLPTALPRGFAS